MLSCPQGGRSCTTPRALGAPMGTCSRSEKMSKTQGKTHKPLPFPFALGRDARMTQLTKPIKTIFKGHTLLSKLQGRVIQGGKLCIKDRKNFLISDAQRPFEGEVEHSSWKEGHTSTALARLLQNCSHPQQVQTPAEHEAVLWHPLQRSPPSSLAEAPLTLLISNSWASAGCAGSVPVKCCTCPPAVPSGHGESPWDEPEYRSPLCQQHLAPLSHCYSRS